MGAKTCSKNYVKNLKYVGEPFSAPCSLFYWKNPLKTSFFVSWRVAMVLMDVSDDASYYIE
jgi:hypothetical protein